uniref:Uncharacterized protein n=1 Tax=Oryza glumipatula TaxID=40148 RepID=A0A0D9Z4E3_9ORYZ
MILTRYQMICDSYHVVGDACDVSCPDTPLPGIMRFYNVSSDTCEISDDTYQVSCDSYDVENDTYQKMIPIRYHAILIT